MASEARRGKIMAGINLLPRNSQYLRVGYVPYSTALDRPGDRRRFPYYAQRRGIAFEIADPAKEYDLVVLTECADISVWSRYPRGKLVYDLIDSYLAIPRSDLKGQLRGIFKFLSRQSRHLQIDHWKAVAQMCMRADAVICSTEEQRNDILNYCPNVHIILDAHMEVARVIKTDYRANQPFRLVWEGLPHTIGSLRQIRPALDQLRRRHQVEMHIVTDRQFARYLGRYGKTSSMHAVRSILPDVRFHEWKEVDCAEIISSCDLAVIPLALNDPFAAGKPENKLLLFWRMGMPVVTSASPAYVRAMRAAGLDLTVKTEADWLPTLERLMCDMSARRDAGKLGRAYTESHFSEESLLAKWDAVFSSINMPIPRNEAGKPCADSQAT